MNSKMFQEPKAPVKLPVTENVSSVLEAAKVSEEEITGCCFKGVFITKFDGKLLRFKKMAFENWNLYNYSSNFPYFTGFPACSLVK